MTPKSTNDELAARGRDLYDRDIRARVEPHAHGKYLALDVHTGDYEVGEDYLALWKALRRRHPDAWLYTVRIGYPALGRIGGRVSR
jgi:hypothetical protein